ncbi:uncharacterized protein K444DRAFT_614354 [Hyaloscypha bicolor E]|uniref:2'-phosphotransferase n=1 Tax=Hyaloscypha bicolor E TaxID=1095630 RepID=A0A2J6T511_9HELO|nr:uncharacterized protein K444DRAFT_614354 [Hyaloscypha bicolor E]PMD58105.1 hypothetical protein K444DRAFT_614354 [Hyaloscypha bicolor E]
MAASRSGEDFIHMAEELDLTDRGGKRGARGGRPKAGGSGGSGSRGNRAGGSGGGEMNREVAISKALSKLLRHAAVDVGLKLDPEGFARVDQVMQWQRLKSLHITFEDIQIATTDNAKQRFSMKPNPSLNPPPDPKSETPSDWVIRANQGHSIAVDSAALLVPITIEAGNLPDVVVHGTYFGVYQAILASGGLKKMSRNHIHFSTGLPEEKQGVISGMRNDAELLIYVDIKKSLEDGGVLWWISENGVLLTEGDENGILGTKYWKRVEGRKQDIGILWDNGEQVRELPHNLRNKKPPHGKGPVPNGKEKLAKIDAKGKGKFIRAPDRSFGEDPQEANGS